MNKKLMYIILFTVFFAVIFVFLFSFFSRKKAPVIGTESQIVDKAGIVLPIADKNKREIIQNEYDQKITSTATKNKDESVVTYDMGSNNDFAVTYFKKAKFIQIVIQHKPLELVRSKAEEFLLKNLSITKEELCTLNVIVNVLSSADEKASERGNYGLSFCSNGKPFPKE